MHGASGIIFDGKSRRRVVHDGISPQTRPSNFIWVQVQDPTVSELSDLQTKFSIHELAVENTLSSGSSAKVEIYDDQIFIVATTVRLNDDKLSYSQIAAFLGERHIVTIEEGDDADYAAAMCHIAGDERGTAMRPDLILYAILDFITDSYLPVMQMIEDEVLDMEHSFLNGTLQRNQITRLFQLRRETIQFQHAVSRMSDVCGKLIHLDLPCIGKSTKPYFSDVHQRLLHVSSSVTLLIEIIGSVFQASTLLEQQRQGIITRQLAAWAAILAVPTGLSGVYGMNFVDLPGADLSYGYKLAVGAMLVICCGLYVRFRALDWL